ncbi:unnamed protein product [Schistosoma margrebowiei]|uniref:Uncharacterized protein n=1 Tax=Schistosoma margrebowiei TaxID=48269 RepID=A0A183NA50_9TREM|nr:unnamed protein product [Schistosoma margrebowiei]
MKTSTSERKHGIQWKLRNQLEYLDFADYLTLLFHTHQHMQVKINSESAASESVDFNIHKGTSKIVKCNTENTNSISFDGESLEDVEPFAYLSCIIDEQGGSDADVKARIGNARTAFLQLNNI